MSGMEDDPAMAGLAAVLAVVVAVVVAGFIVNGLVSGKGVNGVWGYCTDPTKGGVSELAHNVVLS